MTVTYRFDFNRDQFARDGLVRLPGALRETVEFREFLVDLVWAGESMIADKRVARAGRLDTESAADRLCRCIMALRKAGGVGRLFQALASHPGKLLSQSLLRQQPILIASLRRIFGPESVIAFPQMSDALTMFFNVGDSSGALHQRLPIHQDYPYMMQSSTQVVVWIPLCRRHPQTGGIDYWTGSHTGGIVQQRTHGDYFEVAPDEVQRYERETGVMSKVLDWDLGDIVIFDSKLFHRTIPNRSDSDVRVIQVFRASDLTTGDGVAYKWRSVGYVDRSLDNPKTVTFAEVYPERCVDTQS